MAKEGNGNLAYKLSSQSSRSYFTTIGQVVQVPDGETIAMDCDPSGSNFQWLIGTFKIEF